jgi:hypothetical protein
MGPLGSMEHFKEAYKVELQIQKDMNWSSAISETEGDAAGQSSGVGFD